MTKRISVTLPDDIYQELGQWALRQRRSLATLAAFLIESAVLQNRSSIDLPEDASQELKQLADSQGVSPIELAKNLLIDAIQKSQEKNQ
ncbi:MAG: ribbon-helix-helix domain-containing protein [Microcystaceae cyanobacterium]